MKKVLCFLLAVIFVCCVLVHGKNERFSLEVMIRNLTNFEETPSLQLVAECWTMEYYYRDAPPYWYDIYYWDGDPDTGKTWLNYFGYYPVAYDKEYNILKDFGYVWTIIYDSKGIKIVNTYTDDGSWPVIVGYTGEKVYYEDYDGDNDVLEFLDSVRGFFRRGSRSLILLARMYISVLGNLPYFLPWNNTVPKEV